MLKTILICTACVLVGLTAGFYIGRYTLERKWSQPFILTSQTDLSSGEDANPAPAAGTRVLRTMPLARARIAMREFTRNDPLLMLVGAVGNGDEGAELHLVLQHRGNPLRCPIASYSGIAYGYDAWGKPARLNKKGENFVAFSSDKLNLAVGDKLMHAAILKHVDTASLAVAQIDQVTCVSGERWARSVAN